MLFDTIKKSLTFYFYIIIKKMNKKIGLYFGSFNPIHIGHLIVANSVLEYATLDEVWFIVSPHNPLKNKQTLLSEHHRYNMVSIAIKDHSCFRVSDIEFKLPKPSYTIETITYLKQKHPLTTFSMIMGADNLLNFDKWKKPKEILNSVNIYAYNRTTQEEIPCKWLNHKQIAFLNLPLINVSSTLLRSKLEKRESIKFWVLDKVEKYILKNNLYL